MSARARTKEEVQAFILRCRAHRPPILLDAGLLHALRDCCATCYDLGYQDVHTRSTVPAPFPAEDDTGRYAINHPTREDEK